MHAQWHVVQSRLWLSFLDLLYITQGSKRRSIYGPIDTNAKLKDRFSRETLVEEHHVACVSRSIVNPRGDSSSSSVGGEEERRNNRVQ